jgi:hypothetical protein
MFLRIFSTDRGAERDPEAGRRFQSLRLVEHGAR